MYKFLVNVETNSLAVASLYTSGNYGYNHAFSFQLTNFSNYVDLCKALDNMKKMRESSEDYYSKKQYECGSIIVYNNGCDACAIISNNNRVLYSGTISRLDGLSKEIRNALALQKY